MVDGHLSVTQVIQNIFHQRFCLNCQFEEYYFFNYEHITELWEEVNWGCCFCVMSFERYTVKFYYNMVSFNITLMSPNSFAHR